MPTLYVIATPIGNLEDISFRAIRVLKEVDFIICEDTRVSQKLLNRYQIKKPLISYHQHSRIQKLDLILEKLKEGKNLALVSDAGTPGIADPGGVLVKKAAESGFEVVPIPGSQAAVTALSVSGFPADKFVFLGFLAKKGRKNQFQKIKKLVENYPVVLYESPHRIMKILSEIKNNLGNLEIVVGRELTKKFETIYRGKISQILKQIKPKGEFVIIIKKIKD